MKKKQLYDMDESQLRQQLYHIVGLDEQGSCKRSPLTLCVQSLGSWLQCAGVYFSNGSIPTTIMIQTMQIALTALLGHLQEQGTIPPDVLEWLNTVMVPYVLPGGGLSPHQQELATIVMNIMTLVSKKHVT